MGIISGIAKPLTRIGDDVADTVKRGTIGAGQTVKNNPLKSTLGGGAAYWLSDGFGLGGGSGGSNNNSGSNDEGGWGIFKFGFATLAVIVLGWRVIPQLDGVL